MAVVFVPIAQRHGHGYMTVPPHLPHQNAKPPEISCEISGGVMRSSRRSACKPSFVSRDLSIPGGGHFSVADVAARLALRALARGAATYPRMFCPIDLAIDRR